MESADYFPNRYSASVPGTPRLKPRMNFDHGVSADPAFVSRVQGNGGDVHLAGSDTAAKDRAIARTEFSDDYDGTARPQGAAWDIGAYEYVP